MKRTSKELISLTADILNRHVNDSTFLGDTLRAGGESAACIMEFVNEILANAAEGGSLVCATEIDGTLLGFVPRAEVSLPQTFAETRPAISPEEQA